VEVGNAEVEGINLTVTRGVDVHGQVAWEEKPPGDMQTVHVILQPLDEGPYSLNSGAFKVEPDGTFVVKNVAEAGTGRGLSRGAWTAF
jgi:hypothetical protein